MNLTPLFQQLDLDPQLLREHEAVFEEAFTHRSLSAGERESKHHNERLEFLGDAVLELVSTEALYYRFPDTPEGDLTNYRSALVKRENLAMVARSLDLGQYMRLSRGEEDSGGREKDYLLANVVEALIGALYVALGMGVAKHFIEEWILVHLDEILEKGHHIDAKSNLQEMTQGDFGVTPHYKVMGEEGLDHDKTFHVGVYLGDQLIGEGSGNSKKEAQVRAAEAALESQEDWGIKV